MEREEIEDMGHGVRLVEDEDGDTALEVDGEIVRIASERDAARRERDEARAQLAALREAVLIHQSTAHLWDREVSSAEGFAESMGTLIDADSRLCEALAASAPDAEAYTRRVQAEAIESFSALAAKNLRWQAEAIAKRAEEEEDAIRAYTARDCRRCRQGAVEEDAAWIENAGRARAAELRGGR